MRETKGDKKNTKSEKYWEKIKRQNKRNEGERKRYKWQERIREK